MKKNIEKLDGKDLNSLNLINTPEVLLQMCVS